MGNYPDLFADDPAENRVNVALIELQHESECCGFGGTFALKHPTISEAIVRDKTEDVRQTGAARLLTGDCGCLMNIAGALDFQNIKVRELGNTIKKRALSRLPELLEQLESRCTQNGRIEELALRRTRTRSRPRSRSKNTSGI